VWDVTLEGASPAQIEAWLEANKSLRRNQIFAHNDKLKLEAKVPDLKAMDKDVFARQIRGLIVGSRGFPEHWFGLAGDVNFASAKEMGLPPVKRLTRIQNELRFILRDLVTFQIHQAIRDGRLNAEVTIGEGESAVTKATDQAVRIILPELSMRDQAGIVAAATSLSAALTQAVTNGWMRGETAARVFNALVAQLGTPIDIAEEYQPGGPTGTLYAGAGSQQDIERLRAQLERLGNGNGDNTGEPKRTSPVGGRQAA
jgi:hypothetical protein